MVESFYKLQIIIYVTCNQSKVIAKRLLNVLNLPENMQVTGRLTVGYLRHTYYCPTDRNSVFAILLLRRILLCVFL